MPNKKIAICFGTRPEIIKLCLLSKEMSSSFDVVNVFTGQHHSLFEDVKCLIPNIHYFLPIGEYGHISLLYADLIKHLYSTFNLVRPDLVIVQGDTASAFCASFCAFTMGIKVGHVEAGLRTYDMSSPFPEEFNRQVISKNAYYNWCPSQWAVDNLFKENVTGKVLLTGNTIVDTVKFLCDKRVNKNDIIVTLHRRENKDSFDKILSQISDLSCKHKDFNFIFPVHPNPIIQDKIKNLNSNIKIIKPMPYPEFISLIGSCRGIISDSGGIQEEAACLRKKIIVCRNNTERPESIKVGISKVVGTNIVDNFDWLIDPVREDFINPYGNGNACDLIISSII